MANRVMQAKTLKMKRMRRAWAKGYSMRKSGPAKLPGVVEDERTYFTKSSGGRQVDPWLDALFKDNNPLYVKTEVGYVHTKKSVKNVVDRSKGENPVPRAVVLRTLGKMVQSSSNAGAVQGETVFHYTKLIHGKFNELRLYGGGGQYFFIEMVTRGPIRKLRRSIWYSNRERALFLFNHGKICWQEPIEEAIPPKVESSTDDAATHRLLTP